MRILHVIASGDPRGGPIFASELIGALTQDPLEHRVAFLRRPEREAVHYDAPTTVLRADGFELPGVHVSPRAVRALRALAAGWPPDIVQAHGGEPFKYAIAAGLHRRSRVVLRSVGASPPWICRGPRRAVYSHLFRRSARVVAVAENIRQQMIKTFGVSQRLVVTIPNAVDSRRLRPERGREETRRLLGIPESHRVVLSLGALTWEKDPLTLIEVSARMCLDRNDFTHVFVGDGPMRGQVERAVTERALDGRVLLLGNRSDVGDLLSASDVVLFASRADGMEGMPAALIEAGMMARPVVAYAVAGVPEVVEDGTTGALVVPGDVDGLTERTIRLLEDQQMREAMGSAAQLRCASLFDIRAVAPQYLGLYRELAGAR